MGVLGGGDNFSSKHITAMIIDGENRLHLVPIKHSLDNFFLAEINNDIYAFRIDHSRIIIWYKTLVKSFRVLLYTTKHYMPISPQNNKDLEMVLTKNALPKMNKMLFRVLHILGKSEKTQFENHNIKELVEALSEREISAQSREDRESLKEAENIRNIKTFLQDLKIDQICTPVRNITEFIYDDLLATDPQFLGSIPERILEAEVEGRKVTNSPIGTKFAWTKWILIFGIVGMAIGLIAWAFTSGAIQPPNFGGGFSFPSLTSGGGPNLADLQKMYPTPESLKIAIDQHQVDPKTLPDFMRKAAEGAKLPTVTPNP